VMYSFSYFLILIGEILEMKHCRSWPGSWEIFWRLCEETQGDMFTKGFMRGEVLCDGRWCGIY